MTIDEDQNKENVKSESFWYIVVPLCDHGSMKFTQHCVCFTNPCLIFFVLPLVSAGLGFRIDTIPVF